MGPRFAAPPSELLTRKQAADYLNIKVATLHNWASTKRYALPFVKIGRLARYRKKDLDAFIAQRTVGARQERAA